MMMRAVPVTFGVLAALGLCAYSVSGAEPATSSLAVQCADEESSAFDQILALTGIKLPECPAEEEKRAREIEQDYAKLFPAGKIRTQKVYGVSLSGTPAELESLEATLAGELHSKWKGVAQGCSTVVCALGKMVGGEDLARSMLMFHARTGYALSLSQEENHVGGGKVVEQIWKEYEIREAEALSRKMPPELSRLSRLKRIVRVADGYRRPQHENVLAFTQATFPELKIGRGSIVVYDSAGKPDGSRGFNNPQISRTQETFLHEICHNLDYQWMYKRSDGMPFSHSKDLGFRSIARWKSDPSGANEWKSESSRGFVTEYAGTSPWEDFAESCSAYVLDPKNLKQVSPERYAVLKKTIFNGKEFLSSDWNVPSLSRWPIVAAAKSEADGKCDEVYAGCLEGESLNEKGEVLLNRGSKDPIWIMAEVHFRNDKCIETGRQELISGILKKAVSDPEFCEHGGRRELERVNASVCSETLADVIQTAKSVSKSAIEAARKSCIASKDYTAECLLRGAKAEARASGRPITQAVLRARAGGELGQAMQKLMDDTPTSALILECTKSIGSISGDLQKTENGTEGHLRYSEGKFLGEDSSSFPVETFLGTSSFETGVFRRLRAKFEESGAKLPSEANTTAWRSAMDSSKFSKEWRAFEVEVLAKLSLKSKFSFGARKLLQDFEAGDPVGRAGISSEEMVKALTRINHFNF